MSTSLGGQPIPAVAELAERTINDLVAAYPDVMMVLAPLGIDLCCGGSRPLGEALDLHGHDRTAVIERIVAAIAATADKGR